MTNILDMNNANDQSKKFKAPQLSEVLLLGARALENQGQYQKALDLVQDNKAQILDRVERLDTLGRLYHKLGKQEESVDAYEELLQLNSANLGTYYKLLESKGVKIDQQTVSSPESPLSTEQQAQVKEVLLFYASKFPRVNGHLRVGLRHLEGDDFAELLKMYMKPLLLKGAPSVMSDLKEFYGHPAKRQMIGEQLLAYLASMEENMTLEPQDEDELDPTVTLWLYYFTSHHFMYVRNIAKALEYVDLAIEHTPTLLELYTLKGKIF